MVGKLTPAQVKWASQHDWFVRDNGDGTIVCNEVFTLKGEVHSSLVGFANLAALRRWAGY